VPFGSGIIGQSMSSQTHLAHVGTLSGPGRARIWPVIQERLVEDQPCLSVSCCLSAASVRFLGHPVPAAELRLPHGRPTGRLLHPDPNGVATFHTSEIRPGWVLPLPRGGGVHPDGGTSTTRRLPLRSGQPCTPLRQPIGGAWDHETSSGVHSRSPVRSSPDLWLPDGTETLGPQHLSSAPHRYQ